MGKTTLLAALVALWASSAYSLYVEWSPFRMNLRTASERVDAAAGAPFEIGISSYSHDLVLEDCKSALTSPLSRLTMAESGLAGARSCRATAAEILARSPTNAFAAFVGAYSEQILGQGSAGRRLLALSRTLAPNEGWLAGLRIRMIRQNSLLSEEILREAYQDIRTLGSFPTGRSLLAEWYIRDLQSRPAISSAMSSLSNDEQQSFIHLVKTLPRQSDRYSKKK